MKIIIDIRKWIAPLLLPLILVACATPPPTEFQTADLPGMVYDWHNQACPGVTITIDGSGGIVSDVNGRFNLPNLARGEHKLEIAKNGYERQSLSIDFSARTQVLYLKIISSAQLLEQAQDALKNRKIGDAEGLLARAEKINATDPLLLYLQAVINIKREAYDKALLLLTKIIDSGVIEPYVYLTIADLDEYKLGDRENALKYLKKYAYYQESDEIKERIKRLESGK